MIRGKTVSDILVEYEIILPEERLSCRHKIKMYDIVNSIRYDKPVFNTKY